MAAVVVRVAEVAVVVIVDFKVVVAEIEADLEFVDVLVDVAVDETSWLSWIAPKLTPFCSWFNIQGMNSHACLSDRLARLA